MPINRVTLFKAADDDIPAILEKYTTLAADAKKVRLCSHPTPNSPGPIHIP